MASKLDEDEELSRCFELLSTSSVDKKARRNAIDRIASASSSTWLMTNTSIEALTDVARRDPVDSIRTRALQTLSNIIDSSCSSALESSAAVTVCTIKLVCDRFSQESSSEDNRLILATLMKKCLHLQQQQETDSSNHHLDAITTTVKMILSDRWGEIVAEGCDMVSTLAQSSFFGLQADFFVDPLLQSVKTLPLKFRLRCLRSGLHPVMAKSPLTIPKVMEYLEKTWSTSSSPQWQFCLVESVGLTAVTIDADDQSMHLLLPVVLLGQASEFPDVQKSARDLWLQIAPRLGKNRLLKYFSLLLPQLLKEAENWSNEIRTQTAQLLWQLLQESPDRRLELDTVMEMIVFQAGDEELPIRQYASKSARLVGESCPNEAVDWLHKIPVDESSTGSDTLAVLSEILRGAHTSTCSLDVVQQKTTDLLLRFNSNVKTLDCLEALLELKGFADCGNCPNELLTVAFSLLETDDQGIKERQMAALEKLASRIHGAVDVTGLVRLKLPVLLQLNEGDTLKRWRFVQLAASHLNALDDGSEFLLEELLNAASSPHTTPEVKLKSINLVTAAVINSNSSSDSGLIQERLMSALQPSLKWRAGRSAAVLRSAAALCAVKAVEKKRLNISITMDLLIEVFLPLVEDEITVTRQGAVAILRRCCCLFDDQQLPPPKMVDTILTTLLGRVNDVSKQLRHDALFALKDIFIQLRKSGGVRHSYEKKFMDLVSVLSRDEDEPSSQTVAQSVLDLMKKGVEEEELGSLSGSPTEHLR